MGDTVTVRQLLESDEMADVVTQNTVKMGGVRHDFIRDIIAKGLKDISRELSEKSEANTRKLNSVTVTKQQKKDLLKIVQSMSDPRVQDLGLEVVKAMAESKSQGREAAKKHIVERLQTRLPELRQLRDKVIPHGWQSPKGIDETEIFKSTFDSWDVEVDLKPRLLGSHNDGWGSWSSSTDHPTPPPTVDPNEISQNVPGSMILSPADKTLDDKKEKGLGIIVALLEQTRTLLNAIDFCGEGFSVDMKIPYFAKAGVGAADFGVGTFNCLDRADMNMIKMALCPFRFASAFSDMWGWVDNVLGLSNSHLAPHPTAPQPAQAQGTVPAQGGWAGGTSYAVAHAPAPGAYAAPMPAAQAKAPGGSFSWQ